MVVLRPSGAESGAGTSVIKAYIEAPGLDENGSGVPVHVEGTTVDGEKIDHYSFIDSEGYGLQLEPGSYEVTVVSSPIASDGTVYQPTEDVLHLEIGEGESGELEVPSSAAIRLESMPEKEITQEYLDEIFEWVEVGLGKGDRAKELKESALRRYEDYLVEEPSATPEPSPDPEPTVDSEAQAVIDSLDGYWMRMGDMPEFATTVIKIKDGVCTITSQDGSVETIEITTAERWEPGKVWEIGDYESWYFPELGRVLVYRDGVDSYPGGLAEVNADGSGFRDMGWWFQTSEVPSWYTD